MLIPEIILYNTLLSFKNIVYDDYNNTVDKTKTILYNLFNTDDNGNVIAFETNNFFHQATAMFTRDENNVRELGINIGYNLERLDVPQIHILMPTDNKGGFDAIGKNDMYSFDNTSTTLTESKSQTFRSVYNLMITSDNMSEVLLVYYFLRAMFLVFHEHFELLGFKNLQFSGQDINLQEDLAPANIYHRNLSLEFDYESIVNFTTIQAIINKINYIPAFCDTTKLD